MSGYYNMFEILDKAIHAKREILEQERQKTLAATFNVLNKLSDKFGFRAAYVFGSLAKKGHFNKNSDLDIAVDRVIKGRFFELIARASLQLNRDVDLVILSECPFADRIVEEGLVWKKQQ